MLGVAVKAGQFPPDLSAGQTVDVLATPAAVLGWLVLRGAARGGAAGGPGVVVSRLHGAASRAPPWWSCGWPERAAAGGRSSRDRADRPGHDPAAGGRVMPLIALASVKGLPGRDHHLPGPGRGLARPAAADRRADPAGGDLASGWACRPRPGWPGWPPRPATTTAATSPGSTPANWPEGCTWSSPRQGPSRPARAWPPWPQNADTIFTSLAAGPDTVIADCGRLDPGSPALPIAAQADITLLMVRPRVSDLSHLALRADGLSRAEAHLALLLAPDAGRGPAEASYPASEIAATLDIPVQASMPADPRGAADLIACRGRHAQDPAGAAGPRSSQPRRRGWPPDPASPRRPRQPRPAPAQGAAHHPAEVTAGDTPR